MSQVDDLSQPTGVNLPIPGYPSNGHRDIHENYAWISRFHLM
jgi:hypothetical protein